MAGGVGREGRAGRELAARGQTIREKQVATFCKEQTHRQAQKLQITAPWENRIGRKDMPFPHRLAVVLFSDFCGLHFPL